jgi:hypothetical protein
MATSPNVVNYSVLKGIAVFDGVDLGNVTEIEITPDFGKLDHNTQRAGVKSVDKTVVISKKVNIRLVMDEWSEAQCSACCSCGGDWLSDQSLLAI